MALLCIGNFSMFNLTNITCCYPSGDFGKRKTIYSYSLLGIAITALLWTNFNKNQNL